MTFIIFSFLENSLLKIKYNIVAKENIIDAALSLDKIIINKKEIIKKTFKYFNLFSFKNNNVIKKNLLR